MSRSSQEQAARNRRTIVAAASRLIREKGVEGVGIRELMASAGLTQGAFAGQFTSKDALAAEACTLAFDAAEQALVAAARGDAPGQAQRLAEYYFRPKPPEGSCPMATLAGDASRSPAGSKIRGAFANGLERLVRVVAGDPPAPDRLTLLAAMVGAAVLKGASSNETLVAEIEAAVIRLSRDMV